MSCFEIDRVSVPGALNLTGGGGEGWGSACWAMGMPWSEYY